MEESYSKLYLEDKGIGKIIIKLNDEDITKGVTYYNLSRNAENMNVIELTLKIMVIPEHISIEKKN